MEFDICPETTLEKDPDISDSTYIANGAQVLGDVTLGDQSSVWYNAVLRGDINYIKIGNRSNIQDNCTIHLENNLPCIVGDDVTVGHNCILHACDIEDACLIGMGAIILNGAKIGKGSVIGAGSLILENQIVPPLSLVVGSPGKIIRQLDPSTIEKHQKWALKYTQIAQKHRIKYPQ